MLNGEAAGFFKANKSQIYDLSTFKPVSASSSKGKHMPTRNLKSRQLQSKTLRLQPTEREDASMRTDVRGLQASAVFFGGLAGQMSQPGMPAFAGSGGPGAFGAAEDLAESALFDEEGNAVANNGSGGEGDGELDLNEAASYLESAENGFDTANPDEFRGNTIHRGMPFRI